MIICFSIIAICCLLWIFLTADAIAGQWHNKQRGLNFWINIILMGNASVLAAMIMGDVVYNIQMQLLSFIILITNLFIFYTLRKLMRRRQLASCGKNFNKLLSRCHLISQKKQGFINKIISS